MGQAILAIAGEKGIGITAGLDMGDDLGDALSHCDVVVDFSLHEATAPLVEAAAKAGKPVVIGTTGHTEEERDRILAATKTIPIVWAGNYSVGVNLLFHLTKIAAKILPPQYQAEILEAHHRHKQDAPSGTANDLADCVREGRGKDLPAVNGREGHTGARTDEEIGIHAIRGGEIVGEHTAFFIGPNDRIELTHRAASRRILAEGALDAALWVQAGREPGLYNMRNVLGLEDAE